ncbi:MAG: GNAT family N-acetyltransferase [Anaerolineae bacterium]|nr:GNAT family N-acetyltransferase [Anaerolineae bacterium]
MAQFLVRATRSSDLSAVRRLHAWARRVFANFGEEDLPGYVASQGPLYGWVAEDGGRLQGFLACTAKRAGWPEVRGLLLAEAWPSDDLMLALCGRAGADLRGLEAEGLVCLTSEDWLVTLLERAGFRVEERVISLRWQGASWTDATSDGPPVRLRLAQGSDLAALVALDDAAFDPIWRLDRPGISLYLVTTTHFVVAEQDGVLVGYAVTDARGSEAQIIRLAVHPTARRQGVGRRLLLDALAHARGENAETAILNTQASNAASQRLYHRLGFREVGKGLSVLVRRL